MNHGQILNDPYWTAEPMYRKHWWQVWREVEPPPPEPIQVVRVELDPLHDDHRIERAEVRFHRSGWRGEYRELSFWNQPRELELVLTGVRKFWTVDGLGVDDNQSPWTKSNVQHWDVT